MGVGSGIGVDMVESESLPQQIDFQQALPESERKEPVIVKELACGQNTMLFRDHKNRLYKTGLKIDYSPKLIVMNKELITPEKVSMMACGRRHYTILDTDNNIHCIGGVINKKSIGSYDGFEVYDADLLFDEGKITQLSM